MELRVDDSFGDCTYVERSGFVDIRTDKATWGGADSAHQTREIPAIRNHYSPEVAEWPKVLLMKPASGNILPSDALPPERATFGGRMTF